MKPELTNVAYLRAMNGASEDLGRRLLELVEPTRAESGCLRYDIYRSVADSNGWMVVEDWMNQAAFDFHMQTPYVQSFMRDLPSLAAQDADLRAYRQMSPVAETSEVNE